MFKEAAQLEHEIATPFVGGAPDQFATKALATERASENYTAATFMGWRRENGRVGVRNHVVLLPLDDLSNAACEAVANNVKGTMALPFTSGAQSRVARSTSSIRTFSVARSPSPCTTPSRTTPASRRPQSRRRSTIPSRTAS
ncbi:UxaA family hydrolase [Methylobacterium organophilum]|nr:UxaA family hydrolase [Methylobacterium organophilum]